MVVGLAAHQGKPIKAYEIYGSSNEQGPHRPALVSSAFKGRSWIRALFRFELFRPRVLTELFAHSFPVLFVKPVTSLIGPNATVIIPAAAQPPQEHLPDYEVELTIVIGKAAKDVSEAEALDYVHSYTGANDTSRTDLVENRFPSVNTKWLSLNGASPRALVGRDVLYRIQSTNAPIDNTNPFGPCLVSASSIPDPQTVPVKCTLNGQVVQDGTTADQIFNVRQTIAHLSQGTTLQPGSIILTGTPKGVGFVRKPPLYLKDGDHMSVWLGNGIGTLVNDVKEERPLLTHPDVGLSHYTSKSLAAMAPIKTQWTRLIRFVAVETYNVHIGQPVDPELDVGLAAHEGKTIKAYEIVGASPLDPAASVTNNILTVKQLLIPLSREQVGLVRGLGLNYSDHAAEANLPKPPFPILFVKPVTSLIGPNASIIIPRAAQPPEEHLPDYEVELTVIIGKAAKDVSEADALDFVLAYTGANDVSFRKHQNAVSQWCFSKGFGSFFLPAGNTQIANLMCSSDNTNPFGPCLVSATAIPDPQSVPLKCTLNGQVMQDGTTADQIFTIRKSIQWLSQGTTLEPGSIIMTGTPKGVGSVKEPPVYLKDGDSTAVWLGNGIGTLINDVKEEKLVSRI
ncbi:hypothetical protein D9758_004109 [Tetrapyrgos nigripes]|uniref:Fumarylacetoacetase-like C-terminal domain-containing protein n=1 Tax=Tetrapyrgos nigripes TaxID=182062 RepID=A0A8H5LV36_9AGAR|nr:hypothetical protein D9758_004109 [Tetrapyrgos nigripes]